MKGLFLVLTVLVMQGAHAARVDTVGVYSAAMNRAFSSVVITPDSYQKGKSLYPVVYLLHGYGGSFNNWVRRVPELPALADQYQLIIVCPEGAFGSWYFDSPVDSSLRFETYVGVEVPAFIDAHYRTRKVRRGRAITGLSMGGHGGLFIGFRHASTFGACGSMSGALVIDYITHGYGLDRILGDTVTNRHYYRELSIMTEMEHYPKDSMAVILDCGTEDPIIAMSRAAHQKMLSLKIPHDYAERPGRHDWSYWANALPYQLLFFRRYFDKTNVAKE